MIHFLRSRTQPTTDGRAARDRGGALPMVMVMSTVMSAVVIGLAGFAMASLRYGTVAEDRSDRLTAADAGMRYAIDQLKLRNAGCILDTQQAILPGVQADFNEASAAVTCERITTGFEGIQAFAAAMTGETLPSTAPLLSSQSGSNAKTLGGPVYMARLSNGFSLSPPVNIENGPLLYHDTTGNVPCQSVKASTLPTQLVFEPELIFGPVCVTVGWQELFDSPTVPDLTGLVERSGALPLALSPPLPAAQGSYTDVSGGGGCRVFEPGRYTTPPDITGRNSYFKTGDYLFDFPNTSATLLVRQGVLTAGRINPLTTTANEIPTTTACQNAQASDPAPADQFGATFYFAGRSHINVATQGSVEIHTRQQGTANYVSVQTLCTPNGGWCNADGGGSFATPKTSTLRADGTTQTFLFTDSGNNKEFVAHALVYAPTGRVEFGNVSNTATQRMLGGMVVSQLVLQSSTSATNFEISVPTSPITAEIQLTSIGVKNGGETRIQSVVEYRPYEDGIDDRIKVNSWRVCDGAAGCDPTPGPVCPPSSTQWTGQFWDNPNLSGAPVYFDNPATLAYNWGTGSPDASIPVNGFSARFTRTVNLPGAGTYRFVVGTDDGQRFRVDGNLVIDDWQVQSIGPGTNTVDVAITNPCNVPLQLDYFENTLQAELFVTWSKL